MYDDEGSASPFSKQRYHEMKGLLAARVGEKRFKHSVGVAKTAQHMAQVYGIDDRQAKMAGILHDWDKGLNDDQLRARARELGVDANPEIIEGMPWLLHGPTAAAALERSYPEFGPEVFQAIARHTSGAADMSPLDCIIYIADIIEPNRTFGDQTGIQALRENVGKVSLDELYFQAFKYTILFLVDGNRSVNPETLDVWNTLVRRFGL